ncbi:MAG: acetyl-CoA carboxylase biotin carboxyl carrier protein [Planctomycetota bacterium]
MAENKETNLDKVRELIEIMVANDLVEVEIVDGNNKILLKRPQIQQAPAISTIPIVTSPVSGAVPLPASAAQESPALRQDKDEELVDITSPIVGTFYTGPSPDSEPYVRVGSDVNPETVVCIIEAMKVMNEIKAETSGTIAKIVASSGQAVEYGQVLFKVKPH